MCRYRDQDNIVPRRNTPRSLMRAKPPELLAAAAQRRPIAPADTLGFEEPAASRVGTTEDASNVDVPTLPSPPRTYLDEHRNNRVVVPFRKVRCAAAAAWVCIPGLTGCGMATGLDGYPRQVQSVRHRDTQGWTRRDRVETTQRFLGQRLWRPPCCRTRQGRIPTHSPRADAGMLALTSVAGAPLWVLTVRCACQFGGGDFTVEMWVNCKVVNAQNCRLFEFGSEPLVGATFQDDGELVRRATWRSKGGSDDSQRHACVCVSASVYVCVCVCVCVCLCVAGWLAGWTRIMLVCPWRSGQAPTVTHHVPQPLHPRPLVVVTALSLAATMAPAVTRTTLAVPMAPRRGPWLRWKVCAVAGVHRCRPRRESFPSSSLVATSTNQHRCHAPPSRPASNCACVCLLKPATSSSAMKAVTAPARCDWRAAVAKCPGRCERKASGTTSRRRRHWPRGGGYTWLLLATPPRVSRRSTSTAAWRHRVRCPYLHAWCACDTSLGSRRGTLRLAGSAPTCTQHHVLIVCVFVVVTCVCRDHRASPLCGMVFGIRIWRSVRNHQQLRATRAADVACEDDSLGLGLSLHESEFVDDMVRCLALA